MRPWRFATDNCRQGDHDLAPVHASMRPWRFATDNTAAGYIAKYIAKLQ